MVELPLNVHSYNYSQFNIAYKALAKTRFISKVTATTESSII